MQTDLARKGRSAAAKARGACIRHGPVIDRIQGTHPVIQRLFYLSQLAKAQTTQVRTSYLATDVLEN